MEIEKRIGELRDRLNYIKDIFGGRENANIALMQTRLDELAGRENAFPPGEKAQLVRQVEDLFVLPGKKARRGTDPHRSGTDRAAIRPG